MIPIEEYKQYLKIVDNAYDGELQTIIDAVEQRVKNYLNVEIEAKTYTELISGMGTSSTTLLQVPIISVNKIEHLIDPSQDIWYELVRGQDFTRLIIVDNGILIMDGTIFAKGYLNYRVTYDAGYSTIPEDIKLACKELVKIEFDNAPFGQNKLGVLNSSNNFGASGSLNIDPEIESKILKKIERYRVLVV